MSFEIIESLILILQQTFTDFVQQLIDIKNEGHTLTLIVICGILLLLTVQFIRWIYKYLFETQPIEDLLHFKAAPAGDRAAVISIQGQRKYMEDTYQAIPNLTGHSNWSYYGVYDGHGGARCSVYVAHYLHKHVLAWLDAYISHYSTNSQRLLNQLMNEHQSYHTISCDNLNNIVEDTSNTNNNDTNVDNKNTKNNDDDSNDDNDQQQLNSNTNNNDKQSKPIVNSNDDKHNKNEDNKTSTKGESKGIPVSILKIMNEILLKSHRKADQEFLQLANRQRWKDGSTSVCCIMLPAKDLIKSLIDKTHLKNGLNINKNTKNHSKKKRNGKISKHDPLQQANIGNNDKDNDNKDNNVDDGGGEKGEKTNNNDKGDGEEDIDRIVSSLCDDSDRWLFVANTGDSRALLVSSNGETTEMSHDHKPNNISERNRIQSDGGRVVFFGTWRVEGVLAVSRSFGDRLLKRWIIPDPEVIAHKINDQQDLFLILATDGVWDTVSNQEAARCAIECWNNPQQLTLSLNQRLRAIAQKITSFAYTRGSMDNITTLVVHLPSHCSS